MRLALTLSSSGARMTIDTEMAVPSTMPAFAANDLGIRTARLFPHFCTRTFIGIPHSLPVPRSPTSPSDCRPA